MTQAHSRSEPGPLGQALFTAPIFVSEFEGSITSFLFYDEGRILPESRTKYDAFALNSAGWVMVWRQKSEQNMVERGWVPLLKRHEFIVLCKSTTISDPHLLVRPINDVWVDEVLKKAEAAGCLISPYTV
jgi:hypothetical protein